MEEFVQPQIYPFARERIREAKMAGKSKATLIKVQSSVIQTITEHVYPNYTHPWIRTDRGRGTGSGFCVLIKGKKYLITNVHCVRNPVKIQIHHTSGNFPAKVVYSVEECDLAILEADEESLKNVPALPITEMPKKLEEVFVVGYPLGGINVSISIGVVNRIQIIPYLGVTRGIAVQVDAPINFGNSGGPVVNAKGQVVGVAFAGEDDSRTQNMGYMIPTLFLNYVINKFAAGIPHQGLANLGFSTQSIVNPAMRERYGLKENDPGVLVTESQCEAVMTGDILTHVGKSAIDSEGRILLDDIVKMNSGEVVPWVAGFSLSMEGEKVGLGLTRGGKASRVEVPVGRLNHSVPHMYLHEKAEGYVVVGGLVFVTLSWPLIDEKHQNREGNTQHLISIGLNTWVNRSEERYVVISDILDSPLVEGYEPRNQVVRTVNGKKFRNLTEFYGLVESIRATETGFLEFELYDTLATSIVMNVAQLAEHQEQILLDNGIMKDHLLPEDPSLVPTSKTDSPKKPNSSKKLEKTPRPSSKNK